MTDSRQKLIIIGSGWAGFYLADTVDTKKYDIIVISPDRTSAYTPLLASAACGLFNFYLAEEPVRSKGRKISYVKAWVDSINFEKKVVNCHPAFDDETAEEKFVMEYDKLVICPGCGPNTFNTPGVQENALFVKNVSDAMAIRARLFDILEKASLPSVSEQRQRELLHVVIVGGGPTGVEITAELYDLKKELVQLYPDVADKLTITIHDVAPHILSAYDQKLYEYAHDSLLKRKVCFHPPVAFVSSNRSRLKSLPHPT
jgi:NADH:ubiquinone reductase (non-electrogenic)